MRSHMAVATGGATGSRDSLSPETLQLLRQRIVRPLSESGAAGVPQVLELLKAYDLSKPVHQSFVVVTYSRYLHRTWRVCWN